MKNQGKRYSIKFKQSFAALYNNEKIVSIDYGNLITQKKFRKIKKENALLIERRKRNFKSCSDNLEEKIKRNNYLPLINRLLAKHHRLSHMLRALRVPKRTYYNWVHYLPSKRKIIIKYMGLQG